MTGWRLSDKVEKTLRRVTPALVVFSFYTPITVIVAYRTQDEAEVVRIVLAPKDCGL